MLDSIVLKTFGDRVTDAPVKQCYYKPPPSLLIMFSLLTVTFISAMGSLVALWHLFKAQPHFASWSPDTTILAITSLITIITSSIIAVISALSKARIEEHRALSQQNLQKLDHTVQKLDHLKTEVERNTMLTEQAQVVATQQVQQVQQTVEKVVEEQRAVASQLAQTPTQKVS